MGRVTLALGVCAATVLGLYAGRWLQKELQQNDSEAAGTNANRGRGKNNALGLNGIAGKLATRLGLNAKDYATRQVKSWVDDGKEAVRRRFSGDRNDGNPGENA